MKQLFVYINPKKEFVGENQSLVKVQIDNSLELGWKPEDIILATNFDYEYNGIRSTIVGDENYCDFYPMASKENTVIDLIKRGIMREDYLYWLHDLDCYQCEVITEEEIGLGDHYLALTDYGSMTRWSTGSMFFTTRVLGIFETLKELEYALKVPEEQSLCLLTENYSEATVTKYLINCRIPFDDLSSLPRLEEPERIKRINISYNFGFMNIRSIYRMATKPIRAVHFHPEGKWPRCGIPRMLDFFKGKNKINTVLMPQRLIKTFAKHGIV